jgi:hypothetical protein
MAGNSLSNTYATCLTYRYNLRIFRMIGGKASSFYYTKVIINQELTQTHIEVLTSFGSVKTLSPFFNALQIEGFFLRLFIIDHTDF